VPPGLQLLGDVGFGGFVEHPATLALRLGLLPVQFQVRGGQELNGQLVAAHSLAPRQSPCRRFLLPDEQLCNVEEHLPIFTLHRDNRASRDGPHLLEGVLQVPPSLALVRAVHSIERLGVGLQDQPCGHWKLHAANLYLVVIPHEQLTQHPSRGQNCKILVDSIPTHPGEHPKAVSFVLQLHRQGPGLSGPLAPHSLHDLVVDVPGEGDAVGVAAAEVREEGSRGVQA